MFRSNPGSRRSQCDVSAREPALRRGLFIGPCEVSVGRFYTIRPATYSGAVGNGTVRLQFAPPRPNRKSSLQRAYRKSALPMREPARAIAPDPAYANRL